MTTENTSPLLRRRLAALAGVAAIGLGLGLAGCGDSSSPATSADTIATTGTATSSAVGQDTAADATAAVSDAYKALQKTSYKSTTTTTQSVDASGIADEAIRSKLEGQLKESLTSSTSTMEVESPERREATSSVAGKDTTMVAYDGQLFFSANGTTWAELTGAGAKAILETAQLATVDPTALFTNLHADGTEDVNGKPGTRYAGDVSAEKTKTLVDSAFGALGSEVTKALGDSISVDAGTVQVVVDDASGMVSKQVLDYAFGFDIGKMLAGEGASAVSGVMKVKSSSTETVTDVGGDITITKPTATKKVSDVVSLGLFLAS